MIVNQCYNNELSPFLTKVVDWAKERKIPNLDEYIKDRKWKLRASGNSLNVKSSVEFPKSGSNLVAIVRNAKLDIEKWLITLGEYSITRSEKKANGEMKYVYDKGKALSKIYSFSIDYKDKNSYTITFSGAAGDIFFAKLIKRVIYKTVYCISCEACEVECPTGALSVYPEVEIENKKCIHCHNCLEFHDHGCMVADSVVTSMENMQNIGNISKYGTFGLREEWLQEFLVDPQVSYWLAGNNSLGNKQVPSFKAWLKDAEIIDTKNVLTSFGEFCVENLVNDYELIWSMIWINLAHNSELVRWFVNNIRVNQTFNSSLLGELSKEYFSDFLNNASRKLFSPQT